VDPLTSFEAFSESIRNFAGWLGEAAPGGMDVDFLCERNSHFLVIEAKPWRSGVVMSYGQHKALYALSKVDKFRVYLAGEDGDVVHLARVDLAPKPQYLRKSREVLWLPEVFIPTSKEQLASLVSAWWRDAGGD
jgi:hypothetical protein